MTVIVPLPSLPAGSDDSPRTSQILYEISRSLVSSRKVVVLTGAGISCSSGIPDFRSVDGGLYIQSIPSQPATSASPSSSSSSSSPSTESDIRPKRPATKPLKARELFSSSALSSPDRMSQFFSFMAKLKDLMDGSDPSPTHFFIEFLKKRKKLLRCYTQNIDSLEGRTSLDVIDLLEQPQEPGNGKRRGKSKRIEGDVVQLHGSIHRVICTLCNRCRPSEEAFQECFRAGTAPDCPACVQRADERARRSKRCSGAVGALRPSITLYGEPNSEDLTIAEIHSSDLAKSPDFVLVLGTSLKVHGFRRLVRDFAKACKSSKQRAGKVEPCVILVNLGDVITSEWEDVFDYHVKGTTDEWTRVALAHWKIIEPGTNLEELIGGLPTPPPSQGSLSPSPPSFSSSSSSSTTPSSSSSSAQSPPPTPLTEDRPMQIVSGRCPFFISSDLLIGDLAPANLFDQEAEHAGHKRHRVDEGGAAQSADWQKRLRGSPTSDLSLHWPAELGEAAQKPT